MQQDNLTAKQSDYAVFLPAISTFYANYVGRQRHEQYVEADRMPQQMPDMEMLNFLNAQQGLFPYRWALYSAGHANLDPSKFVAKEDMVRNRDPNTFLLGDSGGFQIGKGVWEGDWKNPACPRAQKYRSSVLAWMDAYMDRGMILDIPAWVIKTAEGRRATGINTYEDALEATRINNEYFIANRTGRCKFLNVLQGETHAQADDWYEKNKHYCDPKHYKNHFNGWAMGGQNMCDIHLVLRRLVTLIYDGLLEPGLHDWIHFLGTSKVEWALALTDIQRAIRRHHNPELTISFDCASPFLATANGQLYTHHIIEDRGRFGYRMEATVDDKKYASDNRSFRDAVLQDKIHERFDDSPISKLYKISDICTYADGDVNKLGKVGKSSWDSFSYALLMAHNLWTHINSIQQSNIAYDQGIIPDMLVEERFDIVKFRDLVDDIFSKKSRAEALAAVDANSRFWCRLVGTRGNTGKKSINAHSQFNALFDVAVTAEEDAEEELDQGKLDALEQGEDNA